MSPSVLATKLPLTNTTRLQGSTTSWQKKWSGTIVLTGAGNWNGITSLRRTGKASETVDHFTDKEDTEVLKEGDTYLKSPNKAPTNLVKGLECR